MRLISVNRIKEGMILAKDIYNVNGTLLIVSGTILNNKLIKRIMDMKISYIYVEDPITNDIVVNDVLKEETRRAGMALVKEMMDNLHFSDTVPVLEVKNTVNEIIKQLLDSNDIIVNLAEMRAVDDYTFGHSVNVCVLSTITGITMGYTKEQLLELGVGAILHDIGKVKICNEILNKPSKLTVNEYEQIKKHTLFGYDILKKDIRLSEYSSRIALCHHERFDGKGYPYGIKGKEIHEYSRITTVSDVYDALTTDRIYKKRIKIQDAVEYLITMGGHQFDNDIVKQFLANISVFPLGSGVLLNTGEKGIVIKVRKNLPTKPIVRILYNSNNKKLLRSYDLDLSRNNSVVIVDSTDEI